MVSFSLHRNLDIATARARFAETGVIQIHPFLADEDAQRLQAHLHRRDDWLLVVRSGAKQNLEFDQAAREQLGSEKLGALLGFAHPSAPNDFRFAYERIMVVEGEAEMKERHTLLAEFAEFMSSAPMLDVFRTIIGTPDIDFADLQASRYKAGHFLTTHQDTGSRRKVAYVLGLSDQWLPAWGGLLLFHDKAGDVIRGLTPKMNALSLFSVPRDHSVSAVVRDCSQPRISITGWLRQFADR